MIGTEFDNYIKATEAMAKAQLALAQRLDSYCATREGEAESDLAMPAAKMLEASEQFYSGQLHTQKVFMDHVLVPLEDLCSSVLPSLKVQKDARKELRKDQASYTRRLSTTAKKADSKAAKLQEKHTNATSKYASADVQLREEMQRLKDERIELIRQAFNAHVAAQADFYKQCSRSNEAVVPFVEQKLAGKVFDQISQSRRSADVTEPPPSVWTSDRRSMLAKGIDVTKIVGTTVGSGLKRAGSIAKTKYSSFRENRAGSAAGGKGGAAGGEAKGGDGGGAVTAMSMNEFTGVDQPAGMGAAFRDDFDAPDAMPVNLLDMSGLGVGGGDGGGGGGGGGGGAAGGGVLDEAASAPPSRPAPTAPVGGGGGGKLVTASFAFVGESAEELSFKEGDQITVTAENDDGWWEGYVVAAPSVTGVFPSNYVG
jgi:hypothetical protein